MQNRLNIESPWYTDDTGNLPYAGMTVEIPNGMFPEILMPYTYVLCFHCEMLCLEPAWEKDPWPLCKICEVFLNIDWAGQFRYNVLPESEEEMK